MHMKSKRSLAGAKRRLQHKIHKVTGAKRRLQIKNNEIAGRQNDR